MATTGPSKKYRKQPEICVKEELKIAVKIAIDRFRFEEKQKGKILDVYVIVNCCMGDWILLAYNICHQFKRIVQGEACAGNKCDRT